MVRPVDGSAARIPIGDLAGEPFGGTIPDEAEHRGDIRSRWSGQPVPRVDLLAKLTGGEAYVHDIRLDGMLHGRVIRPHVRTMDGSGRILAVDDTVARAMPGVVAVVRNGDFLGVVAEREEEAIQAAEAMRVTWAPAPTLPEREGCTSGCGSRPVDDTEPLHDGDVAAAMQRGGAYDDGDLPVPDAGPRLDGSVLRRRRCRGRTVPRSYTSTQGVYGLRQALAPLLGMEEDRIRLVFREGAGCYGHNGADDVTADAALLSQAVGQAGAGAVDAPGRVRVGAKRPRQC